MPAECAKVAKERALRLRQRMSREPALASTTYSGDTDAQTVSQASLWGWPQGVIENDLTAARALS